MQNLDRGVAKGKHGIGRECHENTTQSGAASGRGTGIGCNRGHQNLENVRWEDTESVRCRQLYDEMIRISIGAGNKLLFQRANIRRQFPTKPNLSTWLGETCPLTV